MIPYDFIERCYAGWLGKVIGVRHGAPIEGWTYETIRRVCGEVTDYPVDYRDFAADDDTNGPLFFLRALEDDPELKADCEKMGEAWLNYIPYEHGILWWGGYGNSTEHTAYLNLRAGMPAPVSGSMAQNGPAVAEQIGGQIFSDCWGLIWPGNPEKAAEYAEMAARVSHDGDAVCGGRFVAAAIAAAFVEKDIRKVMDIALAQIPADSGYFRMAKDIYAYHDAHAGEGWRSAMEYIIANWGYDRYPGNCHVIPNSAVMIMSMLYGKGDFDDTINICNMCGWDTDCNVGNVGTIMGVLCGLDGIDARWSKPINDFLVSSSVVGCMNITTLPCYVRRLAKLAYRLAGEEVPEKWCGFAEGKHTFDFALPRSTCAFRLDGGGREDWICHEDEIVAEGTGALKIRFGGVRPGECRRAYYGTYYHPADFHDSRYDPAFSPLIYPGQTVSMLVRADRDAKACLYCLEDHEKQEICGETVLLKKDEWTRLTMQIPAGTDGRIARAGVSVAHAGTGSGDLVLYIDHMDFGGRADYKLEFAREEQEQWPGTLHKEITQMTRLKGLWEIWDGRLCGSCADFGEAYTGDVEWRDVEATFRWTPEVGRGRTGVGVRIQGGVRGYVLLADGEKLTLCKKGLGYDALASCPRPEGRTLELTVRAVGSSIDVMQGGKLLLHVEDDSFDHGMIGLAVTDGGRAAYEWATVRVL